MGARRLGSKHLRARHLRDNAADQWVRLGMAIAIIALVSLGLYQFSGRANAGAPIVSGIAYRP